MKNRLFSAVGPSRFLPNFLELFFANFNPCFFYFGGILKFKTNERLQRLFFTRPQQNAEFNMQTFWTNISRRV